MLARSGAKLAISNIDAEGLAATEERLTTIGRRPHSDHPLPAHVAELRVDCATDTIASCAGQAPAS